ncbi:MAG: acetoacetyl-CoA reductase [Pelagibacteraceae bacterium]|jgi:acetoacetyl-CoA reductase|nr:acetoacetyl-CoA reductase [Pelagibacteraceae bacterium]|tara:strand:+ start:4544 stop:5269 length:726 start_codon:yes stop_codon:yes gene_type:complete
MGKVALVTGGTRGIGAAIATKLNEDGYTTISSYVGNIEKAEEFSKKTGIKTYKFDAGYFESCQKVTQEIENDLGSSIDIVVNNAGITKDKFFHKMAPEDWSAVINTNLNSMFNITRSVIEKMRAKKFGRIISIGSINGLKGQVGQSNYSAAKAGIIGFSKAVALENANKGITVNVIAPGYIGTDMVKKIDPKILEGIVSQIPVGRLGEPEEVAALTSYLASDQASFITGATFSINGGQYMQ